MLYHLETSSPDVARSMLQKLSESPLYHGISGIISPQGSTLPYSTGQRFSDMLWTLFYVDIQISNLTKRPRVLNHKGSVTTTVDAINIAAANVANLKRSSDSFLLSVALAMSIELSKITDRATDGQSYTPSFSELTKLANQEDWNDMQVRLNNWEDVFRTVFPDNECNPQLAL